MLSRVSGTQLGFPADLPAPCSARMGPEGIEAKENLMVLTQISGYFWFKGQVSKVSKEKNVLV